MTPARGVGASIAVIVTLLLLGFVATAFLVARRRRHFAHVEEDWPPHADGSPTTPAVTTPASLVPTAQAFRELCAQELERAGWSTQAGFTGGGAGPDLVGRRDGAMVVVRCRASQTAVTGEMVDEAAAMGARQVGALIVLASNAPFSTQAQGEAARHRVHLRRETELADFRG